METFKEFLQCIHATVSYDKKWNRYTVEVQLPDSVVANCELLDLIRSINRCIKDNAPFKRRIRNILFFSSSQEVVDYINNRSMSSAELRGEIVGWQWEDRSYCCGDSHTKTDRKVYESKLEAFTAAYAQYKEHESSVSKITRPIHLDPIFKHKIVYQYRSQVVCAPESSHTIEVYPVYRN